MIMKGIVLSYMRSKEYQHNNHMIIKPLGIESKEQAATLIGKKVLWKSPSGKLLVGKITRTHGIRGEVKAIFKKALPGQAIGGYVEIK
ncbi:50S ribosomal protein L35ae [Thermococcus sibiricus]|uniref:Large ribosomal subunit protein eL33 n=1 Tax=Thermococcus sibiricus (strain DSM 12597 / MM 739) TaxID=604354 RepID=C6A1T7_THESM|nr:50S ribosomal protein L35ae [Thermococcus sibiricus]ACS89582.1 50S ribosomal protein L35Ae [Thermococcus sibiricus MM 739]